LPEASTTRRTGELARHLGVDAWGPGETVLRYKAAARRTVPPPSLDRSGPTADTAARVPDLFEEGRPIFPLTGRGGAGLSSVAVTLSDAGCRISRGGERALGMPQWIHVARVESPAAFALTAGDRGDWTSKGWRSGTCRELLSWLRRHGVANGRYPLEVDTDPAGRPRLVFRVPG